jgi:hypothetical protein
MRLLAHIVLVLSFVATSGVPVSVDYCRALIAGDVCDVDCSDSACCEGETSESEDDCCGTTVVVSALDLDGTAPATTKVPDVPLSVALPVLEPLADRSEALVISVRPSTHSPPEAPPEVLCCFRI